MHCSKTFYSNKIAETLIQTNFFLILDIDECTNLPCHLNADCTNTPGSFACKCAMGYEGEGFDCSSKYIQVQYNIYHAEAYAL